MSALSIENSVSPLNSTGLNQASSLPGNDQNLNQADFIQLLVAQVKNQDPSKPLEPSQFMSQLAQFSTVNGVQDLNSSFEGLSDKLSSGQSIQAAGLVGRSVMIAGGEGLLETGSGMTGALQLPQAASDVTLRILNARGEQVRTLPLGGHAEGELQFQWDGFDDNGVALPGGSYSIQADAFIAGTSKAIDVSIETRIDSVTLNQDATGTPLATTLNLASGASVALSSVQQFK